MSKRILFRPDPANKPAKPYPEFPLTAHPAGYWCKKIRGKIHYFGPWDDPDRRAAIVVHGELRGRGCIRGAQDHALVPLRLAGEPRGELDHRRGDPVGGEELAVGVDLDHALLERRVDLER